MTPDRSGAPAADQAPRPGRHSRRTALLVATDPDTAVGGGVLRLRALRAALSAGSPAVTVVVPCDRRRLCRLTCAADATATTPFDGPYYLAKHCPVYLRRLADDLDRLGVTTVVCSELDLYQSIPALAADGRFRVICDMHNVESALSRDLAAVGTARHSAAAVETISRLERAAIGAAHQVWVPSPADRDLLVRRHAGAATPDVRVVPNVVRTGPAPDLGPPPERIAFTGRLDYLPNRIAAEFLADEVVPALRRRGVRLPVVVAGAAPGPELSRRLREAGVHVVADPPSTQDYIRHSLLAVPLQLGGGSRLKILEGFATGAPVISTRKGVEGLDVCAGEHFVAAETAEEFAQAVEDLTADAARRRHLAAAARRLVVARYSVESLTDRIAPLVARSADRPTSTPEGTP